MPTPTVSITTKVEVTFEMIANAVTGAIENGYSQWLHNVSPTHESRAAVELLKSKGDVWYASPNFWADSGSVDVKFDKPDDSEGDGTGQLAVDLARITKGLTLMAKNSPGHFADLLSENGDADTDDVFMQYVVLGETIYG